MRATHALAAVLLAADAEAQGQNAAQKVMLDGDVMRFGNVDDIIPGRPLGTVYPDGRVDAFHSTLPREVSHVP